MAKRDEKNDAIETNNAAQLKNAPVLSNRIYILIEGYNQNRLLSQMTDEGIRILSVKKLSSKSMRVAFDYKFKKKAFALIEKMCYNYEVVGVFGLSPLSKWMLSRIGIIAGAVAFFVLAFFVSRFIWKIEITGNERVDSLTITRMLNEQNVSIGKTRSFDSFNVSQMINTIDGIAECTIEVVGTTVKVYVIESKEYLPPSNDTAIGDIVSRYDAEITKVIVSGGTSKVKIGDRIAAGSVLISSEVFNTNQELAGHERAEGSVYGKVFFSTSTIISTTNEVIEKTGKKQKSSTLKIFGLSFGAKKNHSFSAYQSVTTSSYPFYNSFLPFRLEQTIHYEVQKKLVERPIDELIEEYKRDRLLSLIINAGGSEIKTTVTKSELANGLYSVHLYLEAEMSLGQFCEKTVDEIVKENE